MKLIDALSEAISDWPSTFRLICGLAAIALFQAISRRPGRKQFRQRRTSAAWWEVSGPGSATVVGLFVLTVVHRFDGMSEIQRDLGLTSQSALVLGLLPHLAGAALSVPAGLLLGARFPTAVTVPALGLMSIGVLLAALDAGALLMAGRAMGGLGTGAAAGATVALILRLGERRGVVAGVTTALAVLAVALAPVVGQLISEVAGFRVVQPAAIPLLLVALAVNVVLGIVKLTTAGRELPPSTPGGT